MYCLVFNRFTILTIQFNPYIYNDYEVGGEYNRIYVLIQLTHSPHPQGKTACVHKVGGVCAEATPGYCREMPVARLCDTALVCFIP